MNLILNARHAMLPHGGVLTIRASEATDVTHMEVADTGSGIEPADLPHIFESFFTRKRPERRATRDQRRETGCGLGLAFCKKIIDAHQGCISVESQPGQGSKFRITLPRPQKMVFRNKIKQRYSEIWEKRTTTPSASSRLCLSLGRQASGGENCPLRRRK